MKKILIKIPSIYKNNKNILRKQELFSKSQLTDHHWEELSSNLPLMLFQRLLKTLELSALEKKDLDIKDHFSTELFPNSCSKVVTSPIMTELEENPSTEKSLLMKTLLLDTPSQDFCQWLMPERTPTAHNSSLPLSHAHGSTESTLFSEKSLKEWMSLRRLSLWDQEVEKPQRKL